MYDLQSLFTERKVSVRLAALLPDRQFRNVHWDRWSVVLDAAGVATQVRTTTKLYPDDPDVAAYTAIPEEAFDPARHDLATRYGLVWIRLSDIHPLATSDEYVGCLWAGQETLFFRITSSAVSRKIRRFDGPDENGYTVLMLAVYSTYDSLRVTRWASDITRAARDNVNWALGHRACEDRGIAMVFGTASYHPVRDREALAILGVFGKRDDYDRRQKLTGTALQKAKDGGVPRSERQMPHGFRHLRIPGSERRVKDATRGYLPEALREFAPTLQAVVHAAVLTDSEGRYLTPWREVTRLLAVHNVPRRGQTAQGTFATLFGDIDPGDTDAIARAESLDGEALYRVGRSFFINNDYKPRPAAQRAEDPALTLEERLYLQKVTLWRTGVFLQKRENDIRGRDVDVKGERPTYRGPLDEFGYFPIETYWGFPKDPVTGEELVGWGIADDVWDALTQRLLHETRARRPRGGRSHAAERRRFLEDFGTWTTDTDDPAAPDEWTVGARQNNTRKGRPGRQNIVVLRRSWAEGTAPDGSRRGWGVQQSNPARHAVATGNLAELAADLRHRLDQQIRNRLLGDDRLAPVALPARRLQRDTAAEKVARLRLELDEATRRRDEARTSAAALRQAAATFLARGDEGKFTDYDQQADTEQQNADREEAERVRLEQCINALTQQAPAPAVEEDAAVNISVGAYLDETLRRAAANNGDAPWQAAEMAAATFKEWQFTPQGDLLNYRCIARLPLLGGGALDLELAGTINNIRTKSGKRAAMTALVTEAVFAHGRDLDELAAVHETSRRALVVRTVMPWLAGHQVTDPAIKCALLDHPLAAPKQVVYAALTHTTDPTHGRWSVGWRDVVIETYLDAPPPWGFAACPDDVVTIQQLVATLALSQHRDSGLPVAVLAALAGVDPKRGVRRLVVPEPRAASGVGFTRPRFLEYVPGTGRDRVRVKPCPHAGCRGVADRVLLLPEVALSGWGVLCSTCWRAPVAVDSSATLEERGQARWARVPFPAAYDTYLTGVGGAAGSLREGNRTLVVVAPVPFEVAPA